MLCRLMAVFVKDVQSHPHFFFNLEETKTKVNEENEFCDCHESVSSFFCKVHFVTKKKEIGEKSSCESMFSRM